MSLMDTQKPHVKNARRVETEKLIGNSPNVNPKLGRQNNKGECILSYILEEVRSNMKAENAIRKAEHEVFPQGITCKP